MPKSFRIKTSNVQLCKEFEKHGQFYIVQELDPHSHIHGICYEEVTRHSLRNWISKIYEEEFYEYEQFAESHPKFGTVSKKPKGNKFYSIKDDVGDIEAAERYLSKGTERGQYRIIVNNRGVDAEIRNGQYWDINDASISAKRIRKEQYGSHKKEFKEYVLSNYKHHNGDEPVTLEFLIDLYYHYIKEHNLEPTPRSSGQTMFRYLLVQLSDNEKAMKEELRSFYL